MAVAIEYADIAVGADKASSVTATLTYPPSALSQVPFGIDEEAMITCEHNLWGLDGTFMPLDDQEIGYWSTILSGANCTFIENPTITVSLNDRFTSMGIWLKFKPSTKDWASELNIKWYRDAAELANKDFEPDSSNYFCSQPVEAFNKIVITLSKTSKPFRRIRVDQIVFGLFRRFEEDQLFSTTVLQELHPIAAQLPISTLDFEFYDPENIQFMFQFKQPVRVLNDGNLIGVYYITDHKRTSVQDYSLSCEDAIGVLDDIPFEQTVYSGENAKSVIELLIDSNFELDMDASLNDSAITGYIPNGTVRTAIQQICFAIGAICHTALSYNLIIKVVQTINPKNISEDRIYENNSVNAVAIPTRIVLFSHNYQLLEDPSSANTGDDVVKIENDDGTKYYLHTMTEHIWDNPAKTPSSKTNVIEVKDATLVNSSNWQSILDILISYYNKVNELNFSFAFNENQIGDYVEVTTPFYTTVRGVLEKTQLTLAGTIVADSTLRY